MIGPVGILIAKKCGLKGGMDIPKWFPNLPIGIDGESLNPERITTLQEILSDVFGENALIEFVERLRSKKNVVLHLKIQAENLIDVVAKLFVVDNFDIETRVLKSSWKKSLAVPKVLKAEKGVILMDYISGELLIDIINRTFESKLVDLLADWYYKYHLVHEMVKGDTRLRNFIHHSGKIFGVDFEETQPADWMLDIGGTAASLLDTNPIFDVQKRRLCWRFLERYLNLIGLERTDKLDQHFIETVAKILKQTSIRRKDERILTLSKNVYQNGIPID